MVGRLRNKDTAKTDANLQNPLAKGRKKPAPDLLPKHEKRLRAWNVLIGDDQIELVKTMRMMKRSPESMMYIADALKDDDTNLRITAAWAFWHAATKGINIAAAIPALVDALKDEDINVKRNAASALMFAGDNGADMAIAIPAIANALRDDDLMEDSALALWYIANEGNQKARNEVTIEINKIMHSEWFMRECRKNSPLFIELVEKCAKIMDAAKAAEEKEAALA